MRKNEAYWERRAARRVDLMEEDLLRYENELAAIYRQAGVRIQADVRELLKRFSNRYGLSEAEALAMLDKPISPQEIAMLKMRLPMVQDEDLKKAMQTKLEAQAYAYRMSRKEALGMDLQMHAQDIAGRSNTVISKALVNVAQSNDRRLLSDMAQQFRSKGINISPSFSLFSQGYIESLTRQRWYGKDFSQRVWDNTQRLAQKMNTAVMDDLVAGRSNAKVAKTLQEEMGSGYKEAIRLVRTESNRVCNDATMERYKNLGIQYYKILATKDSRTSARCRKEDGRVYPVEEAEAGKNMPPFHPNCRSTTTAVVKKQEIIKAQRARVQEVELAAKELPEPPKGLPEPPRGLSGGNYPEKPEGWKSYPMEAKLPPKRSSVSPFELENKEATEKVTKSVISEEERKAIIAERTKDAIGGISTGSILRIDNKHFPKDGSRPGLNEQIRRTFTFNSEVKESIEKKLDIILQDTIVLTDLRISHIAVDHPDIAKHTLINIENIFSDPDLVISNRDRKQSTIWLKRYEDYKFVSVVVALSTDPIWYTRNYILTSHIMPYADAFKYISRSEVYLQKFTPLGKNYLTNVLKKTRK